MMASRGMGAISPSKMPGAKRKARRDDTDFTQYAEGGAVWDKARPKGLGKPKKLSSSKKASAKAMAAKAGRPYPNLIDNMRAAKGK
jgi:hypothetical protein